MGATTVLFGTLGFTPEKFTPTIRSRSDVEKVVLFFDRNPQSRAAHEHVADFCRELGLDMEGVEVDAFDLVNAAVAIRSKMRQHERTKILFNITGGTKVLASAAMLACILEGVRALYIHDTTQDEVPLPLLTIQYEDYLSKEAKAVLAAIHQNPGCTPAEVGRLTRISKPTVSHHVKRLSGYGLVEARGDPQDQRRKRLHSIDSVRLLLLGLADEDPTGDR